MSTIDEYKRLGLIPTPDELLVNEWLYKINQSMENFLLRFLKDHVVKDSPRGGPSSNLVSLIRNGEIELIQKNEPMKLLPINEIGSNKFTSEIKIPDDLMYIGVKYKGKTYLFKDYD